jgi:hypothetical protein
MPTIVSKVMNQGTVNPIVARMAIQSSTLLEPFHLSSETKNKILSLCWDSCNRLIEMKKFEDWLIQENNLIKEDLLSHDQKKNWR